MAGRSLKTGTIKDVSGEVNIAGGDIYKGYTPEQVSTLLAQITSTFQPKPYDGRCPYKGLDDFEEEDAELFFGRERLVEGLVGRLRSSRILFITGPSGSGKSSLVRAGLIPAWKRGALQDLHSEGWCYETLKPGREPLEALALAFSRLKSPDLANYFRSHVDETNILNECAESILSGQEDRRFVLFLDQFEEVFTQINQEEERLAFLNLLTHAVNLEKGRVILVLAMRSDFVSNCAAYPELNALLNRQSAFAQIGSMRPAELVSAIAQPALRVGLRVDPDLVAQIITDMQGEPGALPLMQFALKDLFDTQQARGGMIALTLADYIQQGGIHKALERHADGAFAKLSEGEQSLARSIFGGLIEIGRGTQDTRRTALFDELVPANVRAEEVLTVVQKLADARLIITDEQAGVDTVTISHEKLIDAWPWLRKLVNENREAIALQNEIASDAKEWDDHQRDASYLYSGVRLINAREQLGLKKLILGGLAQEFIQAGYKKQQRNQVTLIGGVSIVIVLLALAAIVYSQQANANAQLAQQNANVANTAQAVSTLAVAQQVTAQANAERAEKQAMIARAGELAALALSEKDKQFDLALLFGVEAFRTLENDRSEGALLALMDSHPGLDQYLLAHRYAVNSVAFSPNGRLLASGGSDAKIILWDLETGRPIGQPVSSLMGSGHLGPINSVTFSPDGKILASGSDDTRVILWDVSDPGRPTLIRILAGHSDYVYSLAFSPDGKLLVSGANDGIVILWDVSDPHKPSQVSVRSGYGGAIYSVAFSPDGRYLASGGEDPSVILWDIAKPGAPKVLASLSEHTDHVSSVAFSPDGQILVSGSNDTSIILWDISDPGKPARLSTLLQYSGSVNSIAISPDGRFLAAGNSDPAIYLWDISDPSTPYYFATLSGHTRDVASVAFSPDGRYLASGGWDTNIILWDVRDPRPSSQLAVLADHNDGIRSVVFSPDGRYFASGSDDKSIRLWDMTDPGAPINLATLSGHTGIVESAAFSPDGKLLASGSDDKSIRLWDVSQPGSATQLAELLAHNDLVLSVAFSPDGKYLASGSADTYIVLWDISTPASPVMLSAFSGQDFGVQSVAISPNGKLLASGSADMEIPLILWDISDLEAPTQLAVLPASGTAAWVVAFSPDGRLLASGNNNTIILWDISNPDSPLKLATLLGNGDISSVAFSPDGKRLVSGSLDEMIILWDITNLDMPSKLGTLSSDGGSIFSVSFSRDGKYLISGSGDLFFWDLDPQSWIIKACQHAGRNFTLTEWNQYFPGEAYHKTCEQLGTDSSYYQAIANEVLFDASGSPNMKQVLDKLSSEMELDSAIETPDADASGMIAEIVMVKASAAVYEGKWQEVFSLLEQAEGNGLPLNNASFLNTLCWTGSLNGYVIQIFEYCKRAVELAPYDAAIRDSRGLARALTGDYAGAIEDFEYFVENYDDEDQLQQRREWIADLQAGIDPFTPELLEQLK